MPDAIGRFFSSWIATGAVVADGQCRAQRVARLQYEIALVGRHGGCIAVRRRENESSSAASIEMRSPNRVNTARLSRR